MSRAKEREDVQCLYIQFILCISHSFSFWFTLYHTKFNVSTAMAVYDSFRSNTTRILSPFLFMGFCVASFPLFSPYNPQIPRIYVSPSSFLYDFLADFFPLFDTYRTFYFFCKVFKSLVQIWGSDEALMLFTYFFFL